MEMKHLNRYAVDQLKIKLTLFILILGLFITLVYYQTSNSSAEKKFKQQASSLKQKVQSKKNYLIDSEKAVKKWNDEIIKRNPDRTGLKIEEFRALLDDLKDSFNLSNLKINLLAPSNREDVGNLKHIHLRNTTIKITFDAFTDIEVYKFISSIVNELPGYVQIDDLTINATNKIDESVAASISELGSRDIVKANLSIIWHDIDDKNDKK